MSRCEGSSGASGVGQATYFDNQTTRGCGGGPRELLPSPLDQLSASSDIGAQIAGLIVCASREQKEAARQSREAAEKAQCAAEERELDSMKSEADLKLVSGVIQGTTQVASGAMTAGSAASGKPIADKWAGIGRVTEGGGTLSSAIVDHFAAGAARDAKSAGFDAGHAKTAIDDARDLDKDAKEMMNRALGYYKDYLSAKSDTQRAALLKA